MFKIRARVGWLFNLFLVLALGLFMYGSYPKPAPAVKGYTPADRQQLKNKFAEVDADFGGMPRLSLADLEKPIGKDGWRK